MNKGVRLKLIAGIIILFIGIFVLVGVMINKDEYGIPSFAIFKWYREVDGIKEYIIFGKDNIFEYYNEYGESIVDDTCKSYKYNKYTDDIIIECKNSELDYKVIKYKDSKLDLKFDTGDVREFKLEDEDNE